MLPFELTKDTPYLALSGELWSVFYEYFTEIDRVIKGFYCRHKARTYVYVCSVCVCVSNTPGQRRAVSNDR